MVEEPTKRKVGRPKKTVADPDFQLPNKVEGVKVAPGGGRKRIQFLDVLPVNDEALAEPIWDPAEGETKTEYDLFSIYLALGDYRSFNILYREDQRINHGLEVKALVPADDRFRYQNMSTKFRWEERAKAYDYEVMTIERADLQARIREEREARFEFMKSARDRTMVFIDALDPDIHEVRPHEILRIPAILNEDSREEFERPLRDAAKLEATQKNTTAINDLAGLLGAAWSEMQRENNKSQVENGLGQIPADNPIDAEFKEIEN